VNAKTRSTRKDKHVEVAGQLVYSAILACFFIISIIFGPIHTNAGYFSFKNSQLKYTNDNNENASYNMQLIYIPTLKWIIKDNESKHAFHGEINVKIYDL
jgi:hypothetical protein